MPKSKRPIPVCICPDQKGRHADEDSCPCPLHFATWLAYQTKRKTKRVVHAAEPELSEIALDEEASV